MVEYLYHEIFRLMTRMFQQGEPQSQNHPIHNHNHHNHCHVLRFGCLERVRQVGFKGHAMRRNGSVAQRGDRFAPETVLEKIAVANRDNHRNFRG